MDTALLLDLALVFGAILAGFFCLGYTMGMRDMSRHTRAPAGEPPVYGGVAGSFGERAPTSRMRRVVTEYE